MLALGKPSGNDLIRSDEYDLGLENWWRKQAGDRLANLANLGL